MNQQHLPRYFAKSGHVDVDPKKTKKNGAGKGGWSAYSQLLISSCTIKPELTIHIGASMARRSKTKASTLPMLVAAPTVAVTPPA